MKIAILTNNSDIAKYFYIKVSEIISIDSVVIIEKNKTKQNLTKHSNILKNIYRKIRYFKANNKIHKIEHIDTELQKISQNRYFKDFHSIVKKFNHNNTNNIYFKSHIDVEILKQSNFDLFILFGTPILEKEIIDIPKFGSINIHTSILPYYKGTFAEFWQLYYQDFEHIGVTIHYATSELDSGNIIIQDKIELSEQDTFYDLRYKNILKSISLLKPAVELVKNKYKGIPQKVIKQKVFTSKMLTIEKKAELLKKLGYLK